MLSKLTAHPASVGETYQQHLLVALSFSGKLFVAALAAMIHALIPCLFEKTASGLIGNLHRNMITHRRRQLMQTEQLPTIQQ